MSRVCWDSSSACLLKLWIASTIAILTAQVAKLKIPHINWESTIRDTVHWVSRLEYIERENTMSSLILWNSMTSTFFVFTELLIQWSMGEGSYITLFSQSDVTAFHRMKYGGGVLYNLVFTEWRHCVSQNRNLIILSPTISTLGIKQ